MLGAVLLFWGWEVDLPYVGGILAVIVEGVRLIRARWDISDEDYNRVWNFCTLLFIGAVVYAFTANQGPSAFGQFINDPGLTTERAAGESGQKTASAMLQWTPIIFFPFLIALALGDRSSVKLTVFSLIARKRKKHREGPPVADKEVHADWVYFGTCLLAASINNNEGNVFFVGLALLLTWALWMRRSRRFALPVWIVVAVTACVVGFFSQQQLGELRRFLEGWAPQWTWRFSGRKTDVDRARTDIGQIGRMKQSGAITVRVEMKDGTPPPTLLRTASYRTYRNAQWFSFRPRFENGPPGSGGPPRGFGRGEGRGEGITNRSPWGTVQQESKPGTWVFRSGPAPMRINIATYVDTRENGDPLPLPLGFARIEDFPNATIKTNNLGVAVASSPSGVAIFDVLYGLNGSIDTPPSYPPFHFGTNPPPILELEVPANEWPALDKIIAGLDLDGKSTNQMIRAVASFFQDNFTYSLWQKTRYGRDTNSTPLEDFLAPTNRSGHCEYFATATTLLLRRMKIPTRYAVGWSVQEITGTSAIIRERHAHAWCLYYLNGQWHDLDTTPGSWVAEENRHASIFQWLGDTWSRVKFEFFKWRAGQSTLRDYVWWIVGPMLLFLLYRLVRRKGAKSRRLNSQAEAAALLRLGLDSEFYQVEKKLVEFGFVRATGETLGELLQRAVRDPRLTSLRDTLQMLLSMHYRLRFDPLGINVDEREVLRQHVRQTLDQLVAARRA
ncbi:MAG: hypothetical protein RLY20_2607 [Verrucomicrobiota bacterium]|jgi:hypothetical protein